MASVIKPKRSAVAGNIPTTAQIGQYEIAMNTADKKIFTSDGTNIIQIASGTISGLNDVSITSPANGQSLSYNSSTGKWVNSNAGTGDVVGPASSTDNSVVRFDGTTGKLIQGSPVTISDTGAISGAESISNIDFAQFDTTVTPVEGVAKLQWDDGNGTLQVGLKGGNVNLQVGQEVVARVYNDSGVALTDGQIVYISGSQGNRIAVKLAKADSEATSAGTLGMVTESIAIGAEGFITMTGTVNKLNTSGLTAGALVYLSATTAGAYTTTAPTAPNHRVTLGYVERVDNIVGSIYVKVDNGYELDELHNVSIVTAASGNTLIYDATAGVWKNASLTAGTGISVTNGAGSITIGNTGVTSLSGTANQVTASASTGGVTLSLPSTINVSTTGNAATATTLQTARTIGDVSFNGSASIVPERNYFKDTRSTDFAPTAYSGTSFHLKTNTTDGLADGGTYHGVLHLQQWTDLSGGNSHQLGFTDNNNIYIRQSASATTWGSWVKLYDADDATTANTASKLVLRDASGNFSAGTITAALTGNASTATTWQTARTLTIGATGKSVDGSANVSWSLAEIGAAASTHYHDRIYNGAVGTSSYLALSSTNELEYYNSSGVIDTLYLQYSGAADSLRGPAGNIILHAGNYNSYSPSLTGTGASGTWGISITGNAATATTLQTARNINGVSFNGSADITVADNTKLPLTGGSLTGEMSFTNDGNGVSFYGGGRIYKKSGTGIVIRRHSGESDPQVENSTATSSWTILHAGNYNTYSPTLTGTGASGTWGINVTGNAGTATTLQTARTINGTSFNGSANITTASWGTARTVTIGSTGKSVDGSANVSWSLAEIGAQAADADLTAIAALAGTSGFLKKTAADTWALDTNTYLTSNQSISLSGDATGSGTTSIAITLANSGVTAGTYTKVTVDAKGRVTTGASLSSSDVTTALGYTPYNSTNPNGYITSSSLLNYLQLSGGTLTGNLIFSNATSPYTNYIQFGNNSGWTLRFMTSVSGTPTERFSFSDTGAFNSVGAITQNNNQVLHAGNYTNYSPSLTGSGASGSWGISITGSAATLTTGRTIGMTGDVTWTSGSFNGSANVTGTATLATVNSNVGSFGSATTIPVVTVNAKGLVTAVSTATVSGGQYFGTAATKAIAYNSNTIAENITITAGNNGLSAGPITVNTGYTVTVATGANWVIV